MKTFARFVIRFRWLAIVAFLAVTFGFARQLKHANMDPDMMNYMPVDMASRIKKSRIEDLFGGTEMLMVLIRSDDVLAPETLKRVKRISRGMKRIDGVDKVLSLFELKQLTSDDGAMIVDPAVPRIPKTDDEIEQLRHDIADNDIVYGSVISKDFTITAVIAMVEPDVSDDFIVSEIQALIEKNPGDEEVVIGGTPYSRLSTGQNTKKDFRKLMPLGLLIMLVFLFVCFKQMRGVILPFAVVIMSIMVSMGLIPLLGWNITVVTILLPVILIAVANDYGIHMITKFQEENVPDSGLTKNELIVRMISGLFKPVILTGLTTIVGMLCLLGHILIPASQLGILAALGIVFALAASLMFIPAVIAVLPMPKPVIVSIDIAGPKGMLDHLLHYVSTVVAEKPKTVILASLVLAAVVSVGIFRVVVDTDPVQYYPEGHPVPYSAHMINDNLGGSFTFAVVFEGDIKNPVLLKKIDRLERDIEQIPEVGNTVSVARVVRQMSRVLNDEGDPGYDKIPNTRDAVAQYFELYAMSGDPDDFEKMVDFPFEHAQITARINSSSTPVLDKVVTEVREMIEDDPDVKFVGGIADVFNDLAKSVVKGQFISLGVALVVVTTLLMMLFRSPFAGILSAIPLVLSMIILFGLMGLLDIELNMATALLSSIMIGVGIDYTIHFLWRYKNERERGLVAVDAVKRTLLTTGRGIVFNALSVMIGFLVLMISNFVPVRFFGFLVVISIFSCLIGAILLIPALCVVLRPAFLEPKNSADITTPLFIEKEALRA